MNNNLEKIEKILSIERTNSKKLDLLKENADWLRALIKRSGIFDERIKNALCHTMEQITKVETINTIEKVQNDNENEYQLY